MKIDQQIKTVNSIVKEYRNKKGGEATEIASCAYKLLAMLIERKVNEKPLPSN